MEVIITREKKSKRKPTLKYCLFIHEGYFNKCLPSFELHQDFLKWSQLLFPPPVVEAVNQQSGYQHRVKVPPANEDKTAAKALGLNSTFLALFDTRLFPLYFTSTGPAWGWSWDLERGPQEDPT